MVIRPSARVSTMNKNHILAVSVIGDGALSAFSIGQMSAVFIDILRCKHRFSNSEDRDRAEAMPVSSDFIPLAHQQINTGKSRADMK